MEKETKKYLIIGGVLVLTVSIGVVLWKKYQTSSSSTQAATDQSNQDELELEAAALASNAYAGSGAASYSPQVVGASAPTSLADEVTALERALGFSPNTTVPVTTPSVSTPPTSGSITTPTNASTPAPTQAPAQDAPMHSLSDLIRYAHGSPLFESEAVNHGEVLVS